MLVDLNLFLSARIASYRPYYNERRFLKTSIESLNDALFPSILERDALTYLEKRLRKVNCYIAQIEYHDPIAAEKAVKV